MKNVVSIFSKKKTVSPVDDVPYWLAEVMVENGFEVKSEFAKDFDQEAGLWRFRVTVQRADEAAQDMVFWYEGDNPRYATEVAVGAEASHRKADKVVSCA